MGRKEFFFLMLPKNDKINYSYLLLCCIIYLGFSLIIVTFGWGRVDGHMLFSKALWCDLGLYKVN